MAEIRLEGLSKAFGAHRVVRDVSLTVADGEFCVFVGPSGCGKSTLLRLIAGLETASAGRILIGGEDVTDREPYDRHLSMVFQSYALYPHMSVRDNIAFALRTARMPEREVARRVAEAARILRLEGLLERRPAQLSGGQRQRVAIGRAIVREPKAFLFDEPLSNLDAALRADTRVEIAALHRTLGATTIYVTHDQVEAMTLADRIVVLREGRMVQTGTPRDLYERPGDVFVAQFLGSPRMNLVPAAAEAEGVRLAGGARAFAAPWARGPLAQVGVRPEQCRIVAPDAGLVAGLVRASEYHGSALHVVVETAGGDRLSVLAPPDLSLREGEAVGVDFAPEAAHPFAADGTRLQGG
ncbi:ABC transporter ATP-binding protein [Rubellimicrobium sp. CFH 75288]|uniref:ABC transporter ATP-binding protein n=1 Tax=Rubellimicrobium sp. CFH 75288 TaxID=2697034 RepID=UPI00141337C8|nr:ABC transporter ATP-binding protein [Rubellimicrobium sp. CFH 75288]NAZ36573.1 ATP-binding cassette domain-containing protein [Rubellimicrobium sp. CFH 75288]